MGCGHTLSKKSNNINVHQLQKYQDINKKKDYQGCIVITTENSPSYKHNNKKNQKISQKQCNSPTSATNYSSSLSPAKKSINKQKRQCSIHYQLGSKNSNINTREEQDENVNYDECWINNDDNNNNQFSEGIGYNQKIEINLNLAKTQLSNLNHIKSKDTPITDEYAFQTKLGEGSYSKVFKGVHISSKKRVAIKVIPHHSNKHEISLIEKEAQILSKLDHPNIIKIYDLFQDLENIYLVTEYCSGGCLKDIIKSNQQQSSEQQQQNNQNGEQLQLLFWVFQIMSAINYCHSNHILHRDLKPENILFANKQRDIIKIIDFGFSLNIEEIKSKETIKGTPYYMAPEIVFQDKKHQCTDKTDVWSVGVIIYYLIFKKKPFKGSDMASLFSNIKNNDDIFKEQNEDNKNKDNNELIIDFLSQMLQKDPQQRISMFGALQHNIFDPIKKILSCKQSIIENIINFSDQNKKCRNQALQKTIQKFLFYKVINQRKFLDILHCYYSLDANFNGFVEKQYMLFVINQMYKNPQEAKEICDSIYPNESTLLPFSDFFIRAMDFQTSLLSEHNLYHAFKMLDSADTGVINKQRIEEFIINTLGLSNQQQLHKMLDKKSKNLLTSKNCLFFNDFKELFS